MIKAIETHYDGHKFRSRLEARWAVFFNRVGLEWMYEPQGYEVQIRRGETIRYLPDFWLTGPGQWAEVKGHLEPDGLRRCLVLAGAMGGCGRDTSADTVFLGNVPGLRSMLWPVQLHYHGDLLAVPWTTRRGCPLETPGLRVPILNLDSRAAIDLLIDGIPAGHPDWALDALDAARMARFEWGQSG